MIKTIQVPIVSFDRFKKKFKNDKKAVANSGYQRTKENYHDGNL